MASFRLLLRKPHFERGVKGIEGSGPLHGSQIVAMSHERIARLIKSSERKQEDGSSNSKSAWSDGLTPHPCPEWPCGAGSRFGGGRDALLGVQQKGCDAPVAELPDRSVENEVMEVHERGKDQKAGCEVVMKHIAGQPGSGYKQRD